MTCEIWCEMVDDLTTFLISVLPQVDVCFLCLNLQNFIQQPVGKEILDPMRIGRSYIWMWILLKLILMDLRRGVWKGIDHPIFPCTLIMLYLHIDLP